ncbi:ABC transporter permease [Candidatus Methylocalor cossyra]|uniref:Transport permease protein n=1 Tax=Candidatus Methylocalor cossyra TaxID=3108543 RepID=A0ABP1C594_9GAMM
MILLAILPSARRISALVVRYLYLIRGSWPRVLELIYWPTVQMILWGLINRFLVGQSEWVAQSAGLLIGAVLLWDVLYRAQLGVSVVFFEEMYSRNLGQLFVSPLRPLELAFALLAVSLLRTALGVGSAIGLAILLYHYSIFDVGLPLVAFFANLLVMGWAIGLMVVALVLRYGLGAEGLAWAVTFAVAPISGVYYPLSVLPDWLRPLALALPSSHVFEGMRAVVRDHVFPLDSFWTAVVLNLCYLAVGIALYLAAFGIARRRGLLLQMGE